MPVPQEPSNTQLLDSIFSGVRTENVPYIWNAIEKIIEPACQRTRGRLETHHILQNLLEKTMQLWISIGYDKKIEAAAVTEIVIYPGKRTCRIVLVAGKNFPRWAGSIVTIEKWAKKNRCSAVEMIARKGWTRILPGYDKTHIYLEREI